MIIGKSKDPVNLKKIPLRVWTLKDEITATFAFYQKNRPEELPEVKKFYEEKLGANIEAGAEEAPASEASPDEAPAEGEEAQKGEEDAPSEEGSNDDNVVNLKDDGNGTSEEECRKVRNKVQRIVPEGTLVSESELFLFDVNMQEILFFSERTYQPGQTIVVQFHIDRGFTLTAAVDYVKNVGIKSRIITKHPPHHRIRAFWNFDRLGDRSLLRKFLKSLGVKSLQPNLPGQSKAVEGEEVVMDEGVDFDLGELGGI